MSRFVGTTAEFRRHIGPHLPNVVNQITRKHKAAVGACEHCGADGELDAAHVHGRDRIGMINLVLGTSELDALVDVHIGEVERAFRREHDPVEKAILVLCPSCHRKYDAVPSLVYEDGSVDRKPWDASRFRESSNVFGNLRSRPEFRQGEWKVHHIVKVNVRIAV